MTQRPKHPAPFPSKQQILDYIRSNPGHVGKRELVRAFQLSAGDRVELKKLLRELAEEGQVERGRHRRFAKAGSLPDVAVVEVTGTDSDGELIARPLVWESGAPAPRIALAPSPKGTPAIGVGDRVLAKLHRLSDTQYEGRPIRRIAPAPSRVLGVFEPGPQGGTLLPTEKRDKAEYRLTPEDSENLKRGELILGEVLPGKHYGMKLAKVLERLGDTNQPRAVSLICIHANEIPHVFPESALEQAGRSEAAPLAEREDLRAIPLVTIDGEDARDFDDAVYAEPDCDPKNEGGWKILVAIADVAWYVRPTDALDREARKRGNSVYFPDRVVPMLPEPLSNGWCSLKPGEDRPCMAVWMTIDAQGNKTSHRFLRGLMRSAARLTYSRVQAAREGKPDADLKPLMERIVRPLFGAYDSFVIARKKRGVLDLDLPERKVVLNEEGQVERIEPRPQLDSHKLIEEFMIAANVAAAQELERLGRPCMYRVHSEPSMEKLEALRQFLETIGMKLAKGIRLTPEHFNGILRKAKGTPNAHLVNEVVLRSQAQAQYAPENIGHFGLALARYAHFTSPIRRYADLLVHRALIAGLRLGPGALSQDEVETFEDTAAHISATERRAASAERDAIDRYTTLFLAGRVGAQFKGRVNGVTRFGLFVTLDETGADGLLPISSLPDDYYVHDEKSHSLLGRRTRKIFRLGDCLDVVLAEANPVSGGLVFKLPGVKGRLEKDGRPPAPFGSRRANKTRRKPEPRR
jgi:ribonuclease R